MPLLIPNAWDYPEPVQHGIVPVPPDYILESYNCLNYAAAYWEHAWMRPDSFETYFQLVPADRYLDLAKMSAWADVITPFDRLKKDQLTKDILTGGFIPVEEPISAPEFRLIVRLYNTDLETEEFRTYVNQKHGCANAIHWARLDNDGQWSHKYGDGQIMGLETPRGKVCLPHRDLDDRSPLDFIQYYLIPARIMFGMNQPQLPVQHEPQKLYEVEKAPAGCMRPQDLSEGNAIPLNGLQR
jgi:hypothetical protein